MNCRICGQPATTLILTGDFRWLDMCDKHGSMPLVELTQWLLENPC